MLGRSSALTRRWWGAFAPAPVRALTLVLVLAIVPAATLAGCGYHPRFVSGVTRCGDAPPLCPGGFTCDTARGLCVTVDAAVSEAPIDHAGGAPDAGAADAGAPDAPDGTSRADGGADRGAPDGGGTDAVGDAACTADVVSSPDNCGACGHSCGGGLCDRGACLPMVLAGVTATTISVDATRLYYSSGNKILACPKSGCILQPTQLDDMGPTGYSIWQVVVTNGSLFFMSAPTQPGTEHDDLFMCPLGGCPTPPLPIATATFGVTYLSNSGNDVYWSDSQARTTTRRVCQPNAGACAPATTIIGEALELRALAARSDEFYFVDALGLQKCPVAGCPSSPSVPTSLSTLLPTAIVYFGGLIYMQFGDAQHTLNGAIRTCDPVDCNSHVPKTIIANRDPISGLAVDASGVYWIEDTTIYSCALGGCLGGARTVATNVTRVPNVGLDSHLIVTDDAFVYWINDDLGTVKRIAK